LKVLLKYSIPLLGSQLINYFTRNGDNLIVGRYLGSFQLGIYSRGYQFVLVPVKNMTGVISKVMFSSLSVIGDNLELVQKTYLKMIRLVSTITIPIILGVFFLADSFVYIILGENWKEVIIVIKTMTFVGAIQSVGVLVGVIFNSQNKNKLMFNLNIISALFFFGMVIFGVRFGITGLLNSVLFSSLVIHIPQAYFALRTIGLSLKEYFWALFPIIISTVVSFIIMHLLKSYIVDKIGITTTFHLFNLILSIPIMLLLTLFFLRIFNNKDFTEVKNMIQKDLLKV
jgi:PST family polysaccharide transporter